ncbi:hypothetical protein ACFYNN_25460 [Streptomyces sp. NPDC006978]|uniref:hypothetical protein n=1 Tax=unclassified Streptomyces TaxID=2593676 RepID=UPI002AFE21E0|nr:hypothetical protein [Streptomyces sp. S584]
MASPSARKIMACCGQGPQALIGVTQVAAGVGGEVPQAFLAGPAADEGVFDVAEHVVEGGPAIVRPMVWTLTGACPRGLRVDRVSAGRGAGGLQGRGIRSAAALSVAGGLRR